jgi:apolipoprotein D and lipocalin family protein
MTATISTTGNWVAGALVEKLVVGQAPRAIADICSNLVKCAVFFCPQNALFLSPRVLDFGSSITMKKIITALLLCLSVPVAAQQEGVTAVEGFKLDRYLGKWYEIARLDHRFERGMSHVTAEYSMREDGKVRVLNRGYKTNKGDWDDAEGKARFAGAVDLGHLEVSFFWFFYGDYIIFELDPEYRYAWIAGPNTDYLWFLSRTPTVSDTLKAQFMERAGALGFDTSELIFVDQKNPPR